MIWYLQFLLSSHQTETACPTVMYLLNMSFNQFYVKFNESQGKFRSYYDGLKSDLLNITGIADLKVVRYGILGLDVYISLQLL